MPYNLHIDEWLKRSDEDFYTLFVKAWIPFNAWYKRDIAPIATKDTDRGCINHICQNSNTYKDKLLGYLRGNQREDLRFQQEMVDLHLSLLRHQIPDAINPINFKTTTIYDNSNPVAEKDFYSIHYKIERIQRADGGYNYDVKVRDRNAAGGPLTYNHTFNRWKLDDLTTNPDFAQYSDAIKKRLKEVYQAMYIGSPTNVIVEPVMRNGVESRPPHSKIYGREDKAYFIDNEDKIAQVLIQILYQLRCQIFHGSLNPTTQNMEVYEHAYHIQKMLIKELN